MYRLRSIAHRRLRRQFCPAEPMDAAEAARIIEERIFQHPAFNPKNALVQFSFVTNRLPVTEIKAFFEALDNLFEKYRPSSAVDAELYKTDIDAALRQRDEQYERNEAVSQSAYSGLFDLLQGTALNPLVKMAGERVLFQYGDLEQAHIANILRHAREHEGQDPDLAFMTYEQLSVKLRVLSEDVRAELCEAIFNMVESGITKNYYHYGCVLRNISRALPEEHPLMPRLEKLLSRCLEHAPDLIGEINAGLRGCPSVDGDVTDRIESATRDLYDVLGDLPSLTPNE